jgi:hypothetical protein
MWTFPIALILVCLASYGLLIRDMGFYWDDWPSVYFQYVGGAEIFKDVFASDRPLLGSLFAITMPIFRSSIIGWQLFGIFTRGLASFSLWWLLVSLWPKRSIEATWVALLFAVYPGFLQQWIAVTYSHAFIGYTVFFTSMALMILAIRKQRWFWVAMTLSYLTSGLTMFAVDVYTGLEVLRPIFLWIVLGESQEFVDKPFIERIKKVLVYWLPYIGLIFLFFLWRVFLHAYPRAALQLPSVSKEPSTGAFLAILEAGVAILQDLVEVTVGAWGQIFPFSNPAALPGEYWWVVIITSTVAIFYLSRLVVNQFVDENKARTWSWQMVCIGGLSLIIGGWAYWIINLPFRLVFPNDRTTLPMFFGVSLLVTGLTDILTKTRLQKVVLIGLLVGLASGFHYLTAVNYVKDYQDQKDFFWQLLWRIPGMKPGTTLLTASWPFVYDTDNSLSAPLNWLYSPKDNSRVMNYMIVYLTARLGNGLPGTLDETTGKVTIPRGQQMIMPYRALKFSGNTSQMVVFDYRPPACLRILDPEIDSTIYPYPEVVYDILPLSQLEFISTSSETSIKPPVGLFGRERKLDWCHYYEGADLARQQKDWKKITDIGKTAMEEHHLVPRSAAEYLPFIEGYARSGQLERAQTLTDQAYQGSRALQPALCNLWSRLSKSDGTFETVTNKVKQSMDCPEP